MEVSFDLEDGVHPEDSLFDGIDLTLFGAGSDAGSDVGSLASHHLRALRRRVMRAVAMT